MPYDGQDFKLPTFDPVLKPGLDGLAQLSEVLRHPELWSRHRWNFSIAFAEDQCGTAGCAFGVKRVLWPEPSDFDDTLGNSVAIFMARRFRIEWDEAAALFMNLGGFYGVREMRFVTAPMVADAIDALLAEKGHGG